MNTSGEPSNQMMMKNLCELIFKKLSASDLLTVSMVSKGFYKIVGQSTFLMSKIQLNIKEFWNKEFFFEDVKHSERKYAHVKIEELLRSRDEVGKMLIKFSPSIVSIFTRFDFNIHGVMLPKLEVLQINTRHSSSYVECGLMLSALNLSKLSLHGTTPYPSEVIKCLENNTGLKELVFEGGAANNVIGVLNAEIGTGFQLKSLKFDNLLADFHQGKFFEFLHTQFASIEDFKALNLKFEMMAQMLKCMTNCKRLTYSPSYPMPKVRLSQLLNVSHSIVELNLINVEEDLVRIFLEKMPRLQKLYIGTPTWRMFDYLLYNLPSLREFRFAFFEPRSRKSLEDACLYHIAEGRKHLDVNKNISIVQI